MSSKKSSAPKKEQSKVWLLRTTLRPAGILKDINYLKKSLKNIKEDLSCIYYSKPEEEEDEEVFSIYFLFDQSDSFYMQSNPMQSIVDNIRERYEDPSGIMLKCEKSSRRDLNNLKRDLTKVTIAKGYKENDTATNLGDNDQSQDLDLSTTDETVSEKPPKNNELSCFVQNIFPKPRDRAPTGIADLSVEQLRRVICKGRIPIYLLTKYVKDENDWRARKHLEDIRGKLLECQSLVELCGVHLKDDASRELILDCTKTTRLTNEISFEPVSPNLSFDQLIENHGFSLFTELIITHHLTYSSILRFLILEGQWTAKEFLEAHIKNLLISEHDQKLEGKAVLYSKDYSRNEVIHAFQQCGVEIEWGEEIWHDEGIIRRDADHDISSFEPKGKKSMEKK